MSSGPDDFQDLTNVIAMGERNVLNQPLGLCCMSPLTGYFRDGSCRTAADDHGSHTVCAEMTEEFLAYSKRTGNDLSTPVPEFDFPGLQAGDRWCVCAARWLQAAKDGMAPPVVLNSTHLAALEIVPLADLKKYALDLS